MREYNNAEIQLILEHESTQALIELEAEGWNEIVEEIIEEGTINHYWSRIYEEVVKELKRRDKKC